MPTLIRAHSPSAHLSSQTGLNGRTPESITRHYRVERELADRLRNATRAERTDLYSLVYDELFRRVPDHPMLARRSDEMLRARANSGLLRLLRPYLEPNSVFLEIGPGDCSLSIALCDRLKKVYAVDVSQEITNDVAAPENFSLFLSDGRSVPVPAGSVKIAFSNQLIEHLHPEDALEQTTNVLKALQPRGLYFCLTPNRLAGPHDISQYFDETATGLHLREYSTADLVDHFIQAGFSSVRAIIRVKNFQLTVPTGIVISVEKAIAVIPIRFRRSFARARPISALIGVCVVATK